MNGAEKDFLSLVQQHQHAIYRRLLFSLKDEDVAQTLTQECFLKAFRKWSSFRGESSARTWLTRIAINLERDYWRNRRLRFWRSTQVGALDFDAACELLPSREHTPEICLLARERAQHLWKVVRTLSMRERSVFLLRYVGEQKLTEIADCTGLKVGTVKVYLARALAKVRSELAPRQTHK